MRLSSLLPNRDDDFPPGVSFKYPCRSFDEGEKREHMSPYCLTAPRPGPAAAGAAGAANSAATGKLPSYGGQFGAGRSFVG